MLDKFSDVRDPPYSSGGQRSSNGKIKLLNPLSLFTEEELLDLFNLEEDCLEGCLFYWDRINEKLTNGFKGVADFVLRLYEENQEKDGVNHFTHPFYAASAASGVQPDSSSQHDALFAFNKSSISVDEGIGSETDPKKKTSKTTKTPASRSSDSLSSPLELLSARDLVETESNEKESTPICRKRKLDKLYGCNSEATTHNVDIERVKRKADDSIPNLVERSFIGDTARPKRVSYHSSRDVEKRKSLSSNLFVSHHPSSGKGLNQFSSFLPDYTIPKKVVNVDRNLFVDKTKNEPCFRSLAIGTIWQELGYASITENSQINQTFRQFEVTPDNIESNDGKFYFKPEVRYLSTVNRKAYFLPSSSCVWPFLVPVHDPTAKCDTSSLAVKSYEDTGISNLMKNKTFPAQIIASNHMLLEKPSDLWNASKRAGRFMNRVLYRPTPAPETVGQPSPREGALDRYTRKSSSLFYNRAGLLVEFVGGFNLGSLHNKWQQNVECEIARNYGIPLFGYNFSPKDTVPNSSELDVATRAFKSAFAYHLGSTVDRQFQSCSFLNEENSDSPLMAGREAYLWKNNEDYAFHVVQQRVSQSFRVIRPIYSRISSTPPMPLDSEATCSQK